MVKYSDECGLGEMIEEYLQKVSGRVWPGYARPDVLAELRAHFADALAQAPEDKDRDELARELIADFGQPKVLAKLIKRAKKRCRPMWVKFVVRTCQTILAILLIFAVYTVWFVSGKPTISVDYLAKLNEMVHPAADESLNAAPHYLKAADLYVEPSEIKLGYTEQSFQPGVPGSPVFVPEAASEDTTLQELAGFPGVPLEPDEREAMSKWLQSNQPALQEIHLGAAKPYYWLYYSPPPDAEYKTLAYIEFWEVLKLRSLACLLCWRMQFAAEAGDWDLFTSDLKAAKTLARHLLGCPFLIEQLVGLAIDDLVNTSVTQVLQNHDLPGPVLQQIAEAYASEFPLLNMEGEELFSMDYIQMLFTDDGSGDGHLIPGAARGALIPLEYLLLNKKQPLDSSIKIVAVCMTHPSRRETVSAFIQAQKILADSILETPYQLHAQGCSHRSLLEEVAAQHPKNLLLKVQAAPNGAVLYSYLGQARHQAVRVVVAVFRYKFENGELPKTLEQVAPNYLKLLPQDPFGPGALSYKRQGKDFILYSWGLDFKDDGGKHNEEVFRDKSESGDYVFWPPQTIEKPSSESGVKSSRKRRH